MRVGLGDIYALLIETGWKHAKNGQSPRGTKPRAILEGWVRRSSFHNQPTFLSEVSRLRSEDYWIIGFPSGNICILAYRHVKSKNRVSQGSSIGHNEFGVFMEVFKLTPASSALLMAGTRM
jgi:hypothetical protein